MSLYYILIAGSFNPLTNAHVDMCKIASSALGIEDVMMVLNTSNADKGKAATDDLIRRAESLLMFSEAESNRVSQSSPAQGCSSTLSSSVLRYSIALCSVGRFVDQAKAIRSSSDVSSSLRRLIFIIGYDTLVRIFEPRFYVDMEAAVCATCNFIFILVRSIKCLYVCLLLLMLCFSTAWRIIFIS